MSKLAKNELAKNEQPKTHYIYLLQTPEFIKSGEPVYKIGKTTQENTKRISGYPPGSRLLFHITCDDCTRCENQLKALFKTKFKLYRGREWFEGNWEEMRDLIYEVCRNKNVNQLAEKVATVSVAEEKVRPLEKQGTANNLRQIFFETRTPNNYHMPPPKPLIPSMPSVPLAHQSVLPSTPYPLPSTPHPLDVYNSSVFEDESTKKLNDEIKSGKATRKFMPNTIHSYAKLHPEIVGFDYIGDQFYAIFMKHSRKLPEAFDIDNPKNIDYLKKFPATPVFLVTNVSHASENDSELMSQQQLLKRFHVNLPDLFAFKIRSGGLWFGTVYQIRKFDQISVDIDALLDDIRSLAKNE